ncbi:energy-coupling factor transporter transmembrane component T family protein [Spirochaeta thermophila]|uniref:energy-coupling factor transporter transmembrane component T family protein n=1 Tax=Winmispira thermophila TaxID=154 RepID=UPI0002EA2E2E|nr:energy-coupling factor transporter transmembrane component T [Spirochaeta thermophila]
MRDTLLFFYQPGAGVLHRVDVRSKALGFVWACVATMASGRWGLGLLGVLGVGLCVGGGVRGVWRSVRGVLVLGALVLVGRALSTEGVVVWEGWGLRATAEGLVRGAVGAGKLGLLVVWAHLFLASTPLSSFEAALAWLLSPIPGLRRLRGLIAGTLSLMLSFLPLIAHQAALIRDALSARLLSPSRRPIHSLTLLSSTLIQNLFLLAQETADALTARSYTFTPPPLPPGPSLLPPLPFLAVLTPLTVLLALLPA